MENTNKISPLVAQVGLNTDNIASQLKEGQLTFAKNAMVENFDGNSVTYQNEISNILCTTFKDGFTVIGLRNIVEQNRTIVLLLNTTTNESEIGERTNTTCNYKTIISDPCLNFNIDYPVRKIEVKTTNCSTQLYWTDNYNPPRWMDLDDLPMVEIANPNNENDPIKTDEVDCNKLLIFPKFSIPTATPVRIETGGSLVPGTYQFGIQYSNSLGEGFTSFYAITNPIGVFENRTGDNTSPTTQAINLTIDDLDTTGLYDYFNLVVLETVNLVTTPKLVDTFAIVSPTFNITYTGNTKTEIQISINEIFNRFPYYDTAKDVAISDNTLQWVDLTIKQKINYQPIWSKVILQWVSHILPVNQFEAYNNPINTSNYRGYMRDEVYAFEGAFILSDGRITESFHIPGRLANPTDLQVINNADSQNTLADPCDPIESKLRWQVYNTANRIDFTDEYKGSLDKDCYKGSYEYGEFSYWESSLNYPVNTTIWGDLSGKPIRHHKFPDCIISPIHDNGNGDPNYEHRIFPIGVKVVAESVYAAINDSDLTDAQKADIQGFMIFRANRADNNQSVVAKGLLFNVGKYERENQTYYYPNYPLNDLRPDPFILTQEPLDHSGLNVNIRLDGFSSIDSKRRFTFHSPDTHFGRPFGIDTGYLKLETVEQGTTRSHFVKVNDNAQYKFLTRDTIQVAFALGMSSIVTFEAGGGTLGVDFSAGINMSNIAPSMLASLELLKNVTPAENYGWNFNSVGNYHTSIPIPNDGNKIRSIEAGRYLADGFPSVDGDTINNFNRENSTYIRTTSPLPFPHELGATQDNSRYISSEYGCSANPVDVRTRDTSACYASIKRIFNDQYGRMYSYQSIGTGYYQTLYQDGQVYEEFPTVFGGDTFINRFGIKRKLPFFIDNTVGKGEQTDINLDDLGNVGYPTFYYSTKPRDLSFDLSDLQNEVDAITNVGFWNLVLNGVSGGIRVMGSALIILSRIINVYINSIGVPNVNFDCSALRTLNEIGRAYLFAYGIPYFFVESAVNVDYRQATNDKEGNFYPNVGEGIPDAWMQESNVSIINDNNYTYNKTYSKQNTEVPTTHLKENYDPTKPCTTEFPNRIIYSQKSNLEETKNNWLIYRPISYFDFPKNYGSVTAIDGLEDRKLLVRFENKSLLYNVYQTSDTSTGTLYMGNPNFFSQPPLDFAETDTGYNGSQHKFLLRTEYGHITVDSHRGQIFLYRGNKIEDISSHGMEKWFSENLPFRMKNYFPDINIDNAFKDIGLTGVYDALYKRIIITKRDYLPLVSGIYYSEGDLYLDNQIVNLDDPTYFCNISWTVSYSLLTQSWISFHSYIPNYYIQHAGYFETNNLNKTYSHNKSFTFQNYYGIVEPYILEYPKNDIPNDQILSTVSDNTTILKYSTHEVFYEVETGVYFNKAVIYNNYQCTGQLNLVFKPENSLSAYFNYPKFNPTSKDILVSKRDNIFSFNTFWDIVSNKALPFYSRPCNIPSLDRIFDRNLDYTIRSHQKTRIRGKECRIRLVQDQTDQYKFISKFLLVQTQTSKI